MLASNGINVTHLEDMLSPTQNEMEENSANTFQLHRCAGDKTKKTTTFVENQESDPEKLVTEKTKEKENNHQHSIKETLFQADERSYRPHQLRNAFHNRHHHNVSSTHNSHHDLEIHQPTDKLTANSEEEFVSLENKSKVINIDANAIRAETPTQTASISTTVITKENVMENVNKQNCKEQNETQRLPHKCNLLHATTKHKKQNTIRSCSGSNASSDSLLARMRATEREFDHKVYHINHLLNSANTQITERDDVIDSLEKEVQRLRHQLQEASIPVAAMEHELLDTTSKLMKQVKRERKRYAKTKSYSMQSTAALTTHVAELEKQHEADEQAKRELQRQLQVAESKIAQSEKLHKNELENARRAYEVQIRTLDKHFKQMMSHNIKNANNAANLVDEHSANWNKEHNHNSSNNSISNRKKGNAHITPIAAIKTAAEEMKSIAEWQSNEAKRQNAHNNELLNEQRKNATLCAENDVLRLSISRLLHLISCLPALSEYLKWDELGHEFVFVGYPVHFFSQFVSDSDNDNVRGEQHETCNNYSTASYGNNYNNNKVTTGVEGGVYAGAVTSGESKNIMLNGKWVEQLQDIINDENVYTKMKKIKLYEMEEAGNVVNGLPLLSPLSSDSPATRERAKRDRWTDLMECRSAEKDYWIPFEIFTLAQSFKNKYFAKLPALTHFYPFLIKLNQIWNARLQKRLRSYKNKSRTQELQIKRKNIRSSEHVYKRFMSLPYSTANENEHNVNKVHQYPYNCASLHLQANTLHTESRNNIEHGRSGEAKCEKQQEYLVLEFASIIHEFVRFIAREHYTLRRATRIQVSSHRYLELFARYDEFVKHIMLYLGQLSEHMQEHDANAERVNRNDNNDIDDVDINKSCNNKEREQFDMVDSDVEHNEMSSHVARKAARKAMANAKKREYLEEEEEEQSDEAEDDEVTIATASAAAAAVEKEEVIEKLLDVIEYCCTDVSNEIDIFTERVMQVSRDMQLLMQKLHTCLRLENTNKLVTNRTPSFTKNIANDAIDYDTSREQKAECEKLADYSNNNKDVMVYDIYDGESCLQIIESAIDFSNEIIDVVQSAHSKVQEITNCAMRAAETLEDKK